MDVPTTARDLDVYPPLHVCLEWQMLPLLQGVIGDDKTRIAEIVMDVMPLELQDDNQKKTYWLHMAVSIQSLGGKWAVVSFQDG